MPPKGGVCLISSPQGYVLNTQFILGCLNWTDSDGFIVRYDFYGKLSIY
jgi:hypothetical protein